MPGAVQIAGPEATAALLRLLLGSRPTSRPKWAGAEGDAKRSGFRRAPMWVRFRVTGGTPVGDFHRGRSRAKGAAGGWPPLIEACKTCVPETPGLNVSAARAAQPLPMKQAQPAGTATAVELQLRPAGRPRTGAVTEAKPSGLAAFDGRLDRVPQARGAAGWLAGRRRLAELLAERFSATEFFHGAF